MKRPSFQFYPADWRNNAKLRRCSWDARGAWLEVMCLLHDSEEYGLLRWPLKEIAQAVGAPIKLLNELVAKGVLKGSDKEHDALIYIPRSGRKDGAPITLIESGSGHLWYSSRMVEDEYKRQNSGGATRFPVDGSKVKPSLNHSPSPRHGEDQGEHKGDDQGEYQGEAPSPRQRDGATSSSSSSSKNKEIAAAANNSTAVDPVDNSPPPPNNLENQTGTERCVEIAVQVRQWETARGKNARPMTNSPHIEVWVDSGVTDQQLRNAYDMAVQDRVRYGDEGPISAAFLDIFLAKLLSPSEGASALNRPGANAGKPWQATWSGILAKASELGIEKQDGEHDPQFKDRVFAAAQMTDQEKSVLRADHGVNV